MIEGLIFRIRARLFHKSVEEELASELRFHFEHQVEKYLDAGMSTEEATRQANLRFGALENLKEECRDERGTRWADALFQDLRYALRMIRKQPSFTAAVIAILALGIGANTAIFSVVNAALLRPLPFRDTSRLTVLTESNAVSHVEKTGTPYLDYLAWSTRTRAFETTAAYWNVSGDGMVFGGRTSAERVRFSIVTATFFDVLGVSPIRGRAFTAAEDRPGAPRIFLASDALWQREMGGRPEAIGKSFLLDGGYYTLAGILPPGVAFPQNCDVWLPLGVLTAGQLADRVSHPFWTLARLRPGATVPRGQAELNVIAAQLAATYPATNAAWTVHVSPLVDEFTGNIRQSLLVLSAAVFLILLIACASVASLLLARSETRRQEFAMRAALGAGRSRLIRQSLTETLLLVSIATALGFVLCSWGLAAIARLGTAGIANWTGFPLDATMLGFSAVLVIVTTVLIGLSPALQFSASRFQESLREGSRGGIGPRSQRVRSVLVIAEVAITLILLCGAGLTLSSFRQMRRVDPGFQPQRLLSFQISLPDALYPNLRQRTQILDRLLARLATLHDVEAVGAVNSLPLLGESNWESIDIADRPITGWAHAPSVEQRSISTGYFHAMSIGLIRGHEFNERDIGQQSRGVIVNQAMADRFWPGENPVGRRMRTIDEPQHWREVVGVVANVKHFGLTAADDPEIYLPYAWWSSMSLVVRSASDPATLVPAVRRQVAELDKGVPVYNVASMDSVLDRSLGSQRLDLFLLTAFAGLALLLSAAGIHGLLAFAVNCRRREIGIRMALGASRSEVLGSVVWGGLRLVIAGLSIGLLGSFAVARLMSSVLFRVSATDPLILTAAVALMLLVGLLACWWPARRATKVDPMLALRCE